jgi:hypothetical protein
MWVRSLPNSLVIVILLGANVSAASDPQVWWAKPSKLTEIRQGRRQKCGDEDDIFIQRYDVYQRLARLRVKFGFAAAHNALFDQREFEGFSAALRRIGEECVMLDQWCDRAEVRQK